MKLIELFEGREETIAQRQGSAVLQAAAKDSSAPQTNNPLDIINQIAQIDKKAVQWLTNMYVKGQYKLEDISRIKNDIKLFNRIKPQLPSEKRDLNRFKSLIDLYDAIRPYEQQEPVSKKKQAKGERQHLFAGGDAKRIYQDQYITVDIPKTEEASCILGKGTKWCTAATQSNNEFKNYNEEGPLYIISTKDGHKYQFHFETDTFMDELDQEVDLKELVSKYPTLKDAFDKIAKKHNFLPLIKNVTPEMVLATVKQDGSAIYYIEPELLTPELALAAAKQNGFVIQYIKPELLTPKVLLAAVKQDILAFRYIKPELQTPDVALAAVKQNGNALQYVRPELQTPEMALTAVKQDGSLLTHVRPDLLTPELLFAAVKQNGFALNYLKSDLQTPELALAAVKAHRLALQFVKPELQQYVKQKLGIE